VQRVRSRVLLMHRREGPNTRTEVHIYVQFGCTMSVYCVDVEYVCKLCMYRTCICYVWMGIVDEQYGINVQCVRVVCVYTHGKSSE
jgi:hypothetical protein